MQIVAMYASLLKQVLYRREAIRPKNDYRLEGSESKVIRLILQLTMRLAFIFLVCIDVITLATNVIGAEQS